jgi:hypothetical protein
LAYFTFQWAEKTWEDGKAGYREGEPITYVARNQFERAGIAPGDYIYVLGMTDGRLLLIGRLQAAARSEIVQGWSTNDALLNRDEARAELGDTLWDAESYILARKGTGTPMRFDRDIPAGVATALEFRTQAGQHNGSTSTQTDGSTGKRSGR